MAKTFRSIRVLLTGGGSGGHVTPLLAIADAIRTLEPDAKFSFVGVRQGLEATIVPRAGIPVYFAPSTGMPSGKLSFGMLRFLLTLGFGLLKAMGLLLVHRPDSIVASGGFASAPTVFAATAWNFLTFGLWQIPIYMHEQNAVPGRMNRFAGRFATRIGISHPSASSGFAHRPTEVVGYPVRSSFQSVSREEARKQLGLDDDSCYLVVTGGSQGARTINRAVIDALPFLAERKNLRIVHACGTMKRGGYNALEDTRARLANLPKTPGGYELAEYLHDMPLHLAAADLALIRAGAGSLVEVCSSGIPAIVIPKANLPGDSQVANARELASQDAIELVYEEPTLLDGKLVEYVPGKLLADKLIALLESPDRRAELSRKAQEAVDRDAAARIADRVLRLARGLTSLDVPGNGNETVEIAPLTKPSFPSSPTGLRRLVEKQVGLSFERAMDVGRLSDERIAAIDDIDYVRYRGAALLVHGSWSLRNEGVKLIGLTRHESQRNLLAHLLRDRTPASRMHRLLGGDFQQVGFVRRNALSALALIGVYDDPVRCAIHDALEDPYYEVRSNALRLVRRMARQGERIDVGMSAMVADLTRDPIVEVRWEAIHTFGHVGLPDDIIALCRPYAFASQPPVREAVLKAYHALVDRFPNDHGEPWTERLEAELDRFAITTVAFHPHFPLKERFATLRKRLHEGEKA